MDTKTKELIEKMRNQLSWIEKDYPVDLYRDAKECANVAEEYAKTKSRETAIEILKWGASNKLEFLLGVWCDNERTYNSPEEIYNLFIQSQQTEGK